MQLSEIYFAMESISLKGLYGINIHQNIVHESQNVGP